MLEIIAAGLIGVVAGGAIVHTWHYVAGLEQRITELTAAQAKRLPFHTADEIENATAALLYVKQANDLRSDMIANCLEHLQKARSNGKKIKIKAALYRCKICGLICRVLLPPGFPGAQVVAAPPQPVVPEATASTDLLNFTSLIAKIISARNMHVGSLRWPPNW